MNPADHFKPFVLFRPDEDDQTEADRFLALLDEDPRHTLLIAMPAHENDEHLDEIEGEFIRVYELARSTGRSLGVKFLHGVDHNGPQEGASRVVVMLHEHKWVGGHCVNGCLDTRKEG